MPHRHRPARASLTITAALALALPAMAQDKAPSSAQDNSRMCGGTVEWLGGEAGAEISAGSLPLSAQAQVTGPARSLFAFRVAADSQAIRAEARADEGDPAIALLTEEGDVIAENDDTPTSLNSSVETNVGPGTYCLALSSVGEGAMAATVQVSRPDQPALLAAEGEGSSGIEAITPCMPDTPAAALAEGSLDDRLEQGPVNARQDATQTGYVRFSLTQPTSLTLRATSPSLDPAMRLFDAQGGLLAENDDADGLNARLDFARALGSGDYCIGVGALAPQPGELTISAERLDPQTFLRNAYRKGELNPPSDGSYPVQDLDLATQKQTVVLHDGAAQWVGFDLDQPTVVIISAYGGLVGADPKLVLFAPNGALAGENDDSDGGTDARLGPILLQPGRHQLGVIDVNRNDGSTGPIRPIGLIFERFLRAE